MRMKWLLSVLVWAMTGCGTAPDTGFDAAGTRTDIRDQVMVHLFEWRWDDIAVECEEFLGPGGYAAVQVSPVAENHVVEGRPWWERYQPVSYRLDTRSGNRAAFADMVARCRSSGVEVYVDAILNHMADADLQHESVVFTGTGTGGRSFGPYDYPGVWSYDDFNHCGLTPDDNIHDWDDLDQVRNCELLDLADLATGREHVRHTLAAYLRDLMSLGVSGFRFDAAKHIPPAELASIVDEAGHAGPVYQEIYSGGRQSDWVREYLPNGPITEFSFGDALGEVFRSRSLADLAPGGYAWTSREYAPDSLALVFVDNHDTQRGHAGILTHKDGQLYKLAQVFALAWPYGRPRVMSSYAFDNPAAGPPMDASENILPVHDGQGSPDCGQGRWVCEHRWPEIAGMVGFRAATSSARMVDNWWSDGADRIAFSRGERGFVVINRSDAELVTTLVTGLPAGDYCNSLTPERCERVEVDREGAARIRVAPFNAFAIHVEN